MSRDRDKSLRMPSARQANYIYCGLDPGRAEVTIYGTLHLAMSPQRALYGKNHITLGQVSKYLLARCVVITTGLRAVDRSGGTNSS